MAPGRRGVGRSASQARGCTQRARPRRGCAARTPLGKAGFPPRSWCARRPQTAAPQHGRRPPGAPEVSGPVRPSVSAAPARGRPARRALPTTKRPRAFAVSGCRRLPPLPSGTTSIRVPPPVRAGAKGPLQRVSSGGAHEAGMPGEQGPSTLVAGRRPQRSSVRRGLGRTHSLRTRCRPRQPTTPETDWMTTRDPARHDPVVAEAIARLTAEFHDVLGPTVVRRTVIGCRRELAGAPAGALPELLERLARQRLAPAAGTRQAAG